MPRVGAALARGTAWGSRSYVCRVTTAQGRPAVLKLALPEPLLRAQHAVLLAARGRGYVQVLAHDLRRGALLMEALGAPLDEAGADVRAALALTAETLRLAWQVPALPAEAAPAAEHKAAGLLALVAEPARGLEEAAVEPARTRAVHYARERWKARAPARQVMVHGDPHAGNLLQVQSARPGSETGFVFVDPEGFLCEPEYDLGVAVRGWNARLLASPAPQAELRAWCEQLARATFTEAEAIWQWGYLERVSTGLYLRRHGLPQLGAPFLTVAGRLLQGP